MEHLRTRLRDLLLLLLEALDASQEGRGDSAREIQEMTAAAGYGEQDLQELLTWLQSRWEPVSDGTAWLTSRQFGPAGAQTLRQAGAREDELLRPEAFGYLLELVRTGQITAEQMESLIQFAQLAPGGPLSRPEVDALLDRVVFEAADRTPAPGRSDQVH